jgi:quercetin dioxygenase-like cupin family protein
MTIIRMRRSIWRSFAAAGTVVAAMSVGALAATAGECPADKVVADGLGQKAGATKPAGVTDKVQARIDLINEPVMLKDHALRLRRLVVQPGGVVPWHSHTDRPAIIYIVAGQIVEYRSTCTVPIVHRAGESVTETKGRSHWWKNTSRKTVVLLSADLFHEKDDPHTM